MTPSQFIGSEDPNRSLQGSESTDVIVVCENRWQVYHRLQELGIQCQCKGFKPLTVSIHTPIEAIQLWSIIRRISQSRSDLAAALMKSWQLPCTR
ncbi:MAG: Asr1405/Asl0597 family protein [Cyanobacteria bacterium P01_F01_bin.53]